MLNGQEVLHGLLQQRVLFLGEDITENRLNDIRVEIVRMALASSEEITLIIDTRGGDCEPTLWFVDFLQTIDVPVVGVVNGKCYSCGIFILQGCAERKATMHSQFYIHSTEGTFRYSPFDKKLEEKWKVSLEQSGRILTQMNALLAERANVSLEMVQEWCRKGDDLDWHFSTQEALEMGLLDSISTGCLISAPYTSI